jgi:site-specific DNA-methyltransferase (adenine-specific)
LKLLLDGVFGADRYINEIIWLRANAHNFKTRYWPRQHDIILFYAKGKELSLRPQYEPYGEAQLARYKQDAKGRYYTGQDLTVSLVRPRRQFEWRGVTPPPHRSWGASKEQLEQWLSEGRILLRQDGKPRMDGLVKYLDEMQGKQVGTVWADIDRIKNTSGERLGYPTQKPVALLERIIGASSHEGDVVLDPFCGCGTTLHAAQKLGRQWIGIDVTHLAIHLIEQRLKDAFRGIEFDVHGTPKDLASAQELAKRDKHEFEKWALAQVDAQPWKGGRKGPDGGIDGIIYFKPDGKRTERAIVEVKGGGTGVKDIGRLAQVMEREKAPLGVFITAENPTRNMEADAAAVGRFEDEWGRTYPKLQIITLAELFQGKKPDIPFVDPASVRRAKREDEAAGKQGSLL